MFLVRLILLWFISIRPLQISSNRLILTTGKTVNNLLLLLLPLVLQPTAGFGLSNNTLPFSRIYHQHSPSPHSQYLKIYF